MSPKTKAAIGIGAIALAAATYYFFGPDGKKHRTTFKGWMIKMKGEVIERMEKAKDMTESLYHQIVDAVAARYRKSGIAPEDLSAFVSDLKKQWKGFATKSSKATKKRPAKNAKKKSAAKKVTPAPLGARSPRRLD